jgi:hypothetical protein
VLFAPLTEYASRRVHELLAGPRQSDPQGDGGE